MIGWAKSINVFWGRKPILIINLLTQRYFSNGRKLISREFMRYEDNNIQTKQFSNHIHNDVEMAFVKFCS